MSHGQVRANGLAFHFLEQGQGPLALCLHGFPDHPATFRHQMAWLAARGHRAVAPFMRGFAPTERPADGRYQAAVLAGDAAALIEALGERSAIVIGHDWGATAANSLAVLFPERVSRLVTIAVPYGPAMRRALVSDPAQQRRSWYMYLFVSPLGEAALADSDFALIDRLWRDWSPGWAPQADHMAAIKAMFREPGVAEAAVGYYRHSFRPELHDPALRADQQRIGRDPITMPALYLHGANDGCIGADVGGDFAGLYTAGFERATIPDAGHFAHLEQPDAVNAAIGRFLSA